MLKNKKLPGFPLEKICSCTGKYYKISPDFLRVPRFFFVIKFFQISPDVKDLVVHFTNWQHCC